VNSTAGFKLFFQSLRRTIAWAFTDTRCRRDLFSLRRIEEVLEVAIFREDIVHRLVDDIVGGYMNESGVVIDLCCCDLIQPNRSTDAADLLISSNGIFVSPI
jgi:hypothetical protein